jgi:hypothetical protein
MHRRRHFHSASGNFSLLAEILVRYRREKCRNKGVQTAFASAIVIKVQSASGLTQ